MEIPVWMAELLDQESAFRPDAFDKKEKPAPIPNQKPLIDLSNFHLNGDAKYTCSFCEGEFLFSQIKRWWRKPKNKWGKPAVPECPLCSNAGAMRGWSHDFSERRKIGERVRQERLKIEAMMKELKAKETLKESQMPHVERRKLFSR